MEEKRGSGIGAEPPGDALERLRAPLVEACGGEFEWPAGVSAGIQALVDFVATDSRGAEAVARLAPGREDDGGDAYRKAIDHFAALLDQVTPVPAHTPASSRGAVVGIAAILADRVRAGKAATLSDMGPELAQYALLPYLPLLDARRWAEAGKGGT